MRRINVDKILVDCSVYSLQPICKSAITLLIVIVDTSGASDVRVKLNRILLILRGVISDIPYDVTSLSSLYPFSINVIFHRRKFALVLHVRMICCPGHT